MKKTLLIYFLLAYCQAICQDKGGLSAKDNPDNTTNEFLNKYLRTTDSAKQKINELYWQAKREGLNKGYKDAVLKLQTALVLEKYVTKPCKETFQANFLMGDILFELNDPRVLTFYNKAEAILNKANDVSADDKYVFYTNVAGMYSRMNKQDTTLKYYRLALAESKKIITPAQPPANNNLGFYFAKINNADSAFYYFNKALELLGGIQKDTILYCSIKDNIAQLDEKKNDFNSALKTYQFNDSIYFTHHRNNRYVINKVRMLNTLKKIHSPEINAQVNSLNEFLSVKRKDVKLPEILKFYRFVSDYYFDENDKPKASHYNQLYISLRDSIEKIDNSKLNVISGSFLDGINIRFNNDIEMYRINQEKTEQALFYSRLVIVVSIITGSIIIYLLVLYMRNRRKKHEAERLVAEAEFKAKDAEVKTKDADLKTTEAEVKTKDAELKIRQAEVKAKDSELKAKEAILKTTEAEVKTKNAELKESEAEVKAKDSELKAKEAILKTTEAEVKAKDAELKATAAELKAQELEKQAAQQELENKKKDITSLVLHNTQVHDANKTIIERLQEISKSGEGIEKSIKSFLLDLKNNSQMSDRSLTIEQNIEKVNAAFYEKLNKAFSNLSKSEAELCGYIRINLSSKDISALKNVEADSVKISKKRLRKKLGISPEEDIYLFMQNI